MVRRHMKTLHTHVADARFQATHFTFVGHEMFNNVTENKPNFNNLAKSNVSPEMARAPSPRRCAKFAEM
jgi:hypothetical protein